eukprot:m.166018 g.166018  ORF g.166018 m.166018 type:complete len:446 (+) comp17747_c2_seq1:2238-3575(+)
MALRRLSHSSTGSGTTTKRRLATWSHPAFAHGEAEIEALDTRVRAWFPAAVTQVKNDRARIHFQGWGARYDFWASENDERVRPRSVPQGDSGSRKGRRSVDGQVLTTHSGRRSRGSSQAKRCRSSTEPDQSPASTGKHDGSDQKRVRSKPRSRSNSNSAVPTAAIAARSSSRTAVTSVTSVGDMAIIASAAAATAAAAGGTRDGVAFGKRTRRSSAPAAAAAAAEAASADDSEDEDEALQRQRGCVGFTTPNQRRRAADALRTARRSLHKVTGAATAAQKTAPVQLSGQSDLDCGDLASDPGPEAHDIAHALIEHDIQRVLTAKRTSQDMTARAAKRHRNGTANSKDVVVDDSDDDGGDASLSGDNGIGGTAGPIVGCDASASKAALLKENQQLKARLKVALSNAASSEQRAAQLEAKFATAAELLRLLATTVGLTNIAAPPAQL